MSLDRCSSPTAASRCGVIRDEPGRYTYRSTYPFLRNRVYLWFKAISQNMENPWCSWALSIRFEFPPDQKRTVVANRPAGMGSVPQP